MRGFSFGAVALLATVTGLLVATPATPSAGGRGFLAAQEHDGKALYLEYCRKCHGVKGEPSAATKKKYKDIKSLADPEYLSKVSNDSMVTVMHKGVGDMKSLADKLSPAEMAAIAEYVRTLGTQAASSEPPRQPAMASAVPARAARVASSPSGRPSPRAPHRSRNSVVPAMAAATGP